MYRKDTTCLSLPEGSNLEVTRCGSEVVGNGLGRCAMIFLLFEGSGSGPRGRLHQRRVLKVVQNKLQRTNTGHKLST